MSDGRAVLAPLLLTLALFAPSSTNGAIAPELVLAWSLVAAVLLATPAIVGRAAFRPATVWSGAAALAVLGAATFISPYPDLAVGAAIPYIACFAMLASRAGDMPVGEGTVRWLAIANATMLVVGALVVSGNEGVREGLVRWYSVAYDDLVANMTGWRKPVFSFGSHSTAAFAYYLLFLMQWETWRRRGSRIALLLALANAVVSLALTSAAAMGFAALTAWHLVRAPRGRIWIAIAVVGAVAHGLTLVGDVIGPLGLEEALRLAFGTDEGGFRGRYLSGGTIAGSLQYIAEHPLQPVGFSYSTNVFYGDSGPVEQLLRGSVPLLVILYASVVAWVRAEVPDVALRRQLLVAVLLFELGFSALTFFRFTFLLPFVVAYLRFLAPPPASSPL
jgi:hypothetical protein